MMIDLALEFCLSARNEEAQAWIYFIDKQAIYLVLNDKKQSALKQDLTDTHFVATVMSELREEKCGY